MDKELFKNRRSILASMLAISILFKMMVFFNDLQGEPFDRIGRFANIFVLMSGVFFAIRLFKSQEEKATEYLDDFKAGMRIAALYAIAMAAFLYLYYEFIDPTYFESYPLGAEEKTKEMAGEELAKAKETLEFAKSAYFNSTISLLGFLLLGSFYSALIAFLVRKFSGFKHQ